MDRERFLDGDDAYYRELGERYGPVVASVIRPFARDQDHADDLSQQVWFRVYRYRQAFAGRGSFEAWLSCIARNVCLSERRLRQGERQGLATLRVFRRGQGTRGQEGSPLERLEREEHHARFHEALGSLPLREAEAITLRKLDGRSADEVASIMGVGKATVRSLIRHGVERLRRSLEMEDDALS